MLDINQKLRIKIEIIMKRRGSIIFFDTKDKYQFLKFVNGNEMTFRTNQ